MPQQNRVSAGALGTGELDLYEVIVSGSVTSLFALEYPVGWQVGILVRGQSGEWSN